MINEAQFLKAREAIAALSRQIYDKGWVPATSGNFSMRLDNRYCAITASGVHKGQLASHDVLCVDLQGQVLTPIGAHPSAETALHTQLYARDSAICAVLHTHDMNSVLVSELLSARHAQESIDHIELKNLELLKAFAGIKTHATSLRIPVFENTQDIAALAKSVDQYMNKNGPIPAYLIKGHGLYTWGQHLAEAMRHLEAMHYLLGFLLNSHGHQCAGRV